MVAVLSNTITNEAVDAAIATFKSSLGTSKDAAQAAAIAALVHVYEHRTAGKLRDLGNVIRVEGKGFVRLSPFTLWLRAFAPVKTVSKNVNGKIQSVLEFDKDSPLLANADETIAAAAQTLWWTMKKDRAVKAFDLAEFHKKLLKLATSAFDQAEEEIAPQAVMDHLADFVTEFSALVEKDKAAATAVALAA
jgi:hypothetical protein